MYGSISETKGLTFFSQIYACNKAYCDSKLAQVLHAKYLDLKLQDEGARVRVYSVHPGMVPSNLWNNLWWIVKVPLALVPSYRVRL
jgi:NAD(P)-dependent dehydrogenase (short-subunit alcohol dehydrogenase family)